MNQLQADRFATWYHFIKNNVKEENFDMEIFIEGNPRNLFKRRIPCGTKACLAGWLPAIFEEWCYPSEYSERPSLISTEKAQPICKNKVVYVEVKDNITNEELCNQLSDFFGIGYYRIYKLILPDEYKTKNKVLEEMVEIADYYGWNIK